MQKRMFFITALLLTMTLTLTAGFAVAKTAMTLDKNPYDNIKRAKEAEQATISMEKLMKELLQETKKTNELLQRLVDKK